MTKKIDDQLTALTFKGQIVGIKREIKLLGCSVYKLEKKLETLFWSILAGLGALSLALVVITLNK
jgi:hypothetical protein